MKSFLYTGWQRGQAAIYLKAICIVLPFLEFGFGWYALGHGESTHKPSSK
jgi:hypothetical protein